MSEPPSKRARLSTDESNGDQNSVDDTIPNAPGAVVPPSQMSFSQLDESWSALAHVIGYLNLYELLQMYETHENYRQKIAEDVMKNRPLVISSISKNYDVREAFQHLGGFTQEVIIKQSDIQYKMDKYSSIEEIVRLIGKHCSNGHLKKVTIVLDSKEKGANVFRGEMPNAMLNIESLTLECPFKGTGKASKTEVKCGKFMEASNGHKWQSLTLKNMKNPEALLKNLNLSRLRVLSIENCAVSCTQFWPDFFKNGIPTLESLSWVKSNTFGSLNIGSIDFAKAFPALKRLRLGGTGCLLAASTLPKLTHLELYQTDIFGAKLLPLVKALKNSGSSIEELSIIESVSGIPHATTLKVNSLWREAFKQFTRLGSIKIHRSATDYNDWTDYIYLIDHIPNVSHVHLTGNKLFRQNHVRTLVKKSGVRSITLRSEVKMTSTFYNKLIRHRSKWFCDSPPIDIYFNIAKAAMNDLKRGIGDYTTKSNQIRLHR